MQPQKRNYMIYTIIVSILLLSICILLMGVKVFFVKNGKFPSSHVSDNKAFKDMGISCMKSQDLEDRNKKNIFELSKN